MRRISTSSLIVIALALAARLDAQAVLRGEVVDQESGAAVTAARVMVDDRPRGQADAQGRFVIPGLTAGMHRLRVERLGYTPYELVTEVRDSMYMTVSLKANPAELPGVTGTAQGVAPDVTERMSGFEYRRTHRIGSGRYITRADLEQNSRSSLANVLRRLPATRIIYDSGKGEYYLASSESPGPHALAHPPEPCFTQVFVNGVRIYAKGRGDPPGLNEYDVNELEAVEFYAQPSSTPAQFRTMDSDCGTLILWTRFAK